MSNLEQQQQEIDTIRERRITLKLSDEDCERLVTRCGRCNLTIGELLENFIGDLIDGTYSNGSDERMYANNWFERCYFGRFSEPTLLSWLLDKGYNVYDDFLEIINNIDCAYNCLEDYQKDPSVFDEEEIELAKTDIEYWEEEISEMKDAFLKENKGADWAKEVDAINQWWKEKERFCNPL